MIGLAIAQTGVVTWLIFAILKRLCTHQGQRQPVYCLPTIIRLLKLLDEGNLINVLSLSEAGITIFQIGKDQIDEGKRIIFP